MMIKRPPQQGHGRGSARGSSVVVASAVSGSFGREGTASNLRARAILAARLPLANSPYCRMRWSPVAKRSMQFYGGGEAVPIPRIEPPTLGSGIERRVAEARDASISVSIKVHFRRIHIHSQNDSESKSD
jgi:hypothetical protein